QVFARRSHAGGCVVALRPFPALSFRCRRWPHFALKRGPVFAARLSSRAWSTTAAHLIFFQTSEKPAFIANAQSNPGFSALLWANRLLSAAFCAELFYNQWLCRNERRWKSPLLILTKPLGPERRAQIEGNHIVIDEPKAA